MKKIAAILLLTIVFSACKKATYLRDVVASHPWKIKQWFENEVDKTRPCKLDDTYIFYANDSFLLNTGDFSCFSQEAQSYNGFWEMSADEKRMNLIYSNHNYTMHVLTINSDKLEVAYQEDTVSNRIIFSR